MDAVQRRAQLLQKLRNAKLSPESITAEDARNIYSEVWEEIYFQVSSKLATPKFWAVALEEASSLMLEKNWEVIRERVRERLVKQGLEKGNSNNKTERNDNAN